MNSDDIRLIRETINEAFEERSRIDAETHGEHHEFIRRWIEKEERRAERWEAIKTQVLGWGAIAIIGAFGTWLATHFGISVRQ